MVFLPHIKLKTHNDLCGHVTVCEGWRGRSGVVRGISHLLIDVTWQYLYIVGIILYSKGYSFPSLPA